jgi:hypothetical protein
MKKSYLMIAATTALLTSCAGNDTFNKESLNEQQAIGFATFSQKVTKAENSLETAKLSLINHHPTFSVWGYKDVQNTYVFGTSTTVGQKVEGTAGSAAVLYADAAEYNAAKGTSLDETEFANLDDADKIKTPAVDEKWEYTPVRFWDKNSNYYEFYAAAPETTADPKWTLNTNTADFADDYFTLGPVVLSNSTLTSTSYVESMKDQSNIDYMIASSKNVANAQYGSNPVQIEFNHILSRLNITVKKGDNLTAAGDAGKLAIVKLEVRDMISTGSFDENTVTDANTLMGGTPNRWTRTDATVTYEGNANADVTDKVFLLQSLIIPQVAGYEGINRDGTSTETKPYIYIEYTIGTTAPETYKAYYNLSAVFAETTGVEFNEGWQNTLNITIDADIINFDPQVFKWDDGPSNNFEIN